MLSSIKLDETTINTMSVSRKSRLNKALSDKRIITIKISKFLLSTPLFVIITFFSYNKTTWTKHTWYKNVNLLSFKRLNSSSYDLKYEMKYVICLRLLSMLLCVIYQNNIDLNIDFHLTKGCTLLICKKSGVYNRSPR